ncbi:phosphonoacetaldehyde reductase [candidate division CSSED10-310 bacterium]|uniref:Phosphonoacetaldehyde reductase n=1 Tax=candidate division CSSED10-310 bacterium TaxID=2855610 RepID=A0ABV6Z2U5_UNCC1
MNQKILTGFNSYEKLKEILVDFSPHKIFLVTGKLSYTLSGARDSIGGIVSQFDHIRFSDFEPNPKIEHLKNALELFNKEKCDFVIGIGGGTVIDVAKAVSVLAAQHGVVEDFVEAVSPITVNRQTPLVIIPTTSGTGSESTHFSVVYIDKNKYSLGHPSLLPDFAILDPLLTLTLPPYLTACTGMDALCQGIESFWSVNSTAESREYSKQAITLAVDNLAKCVHNPDDSSRESMLLASNYAGRAINISKTTGPHAVSYPLTSYFNIPHGHAVALTLPYFIDFNNCVTSQDIQDLRGEDFVLSIMKDLFGILGVAGANDARKMMLKLMKNIGLAVNLTELGLNPERIEIIIKNGLNPERVKNNPRRLSETSLGGILEHIV